MSLYPALDFVAPGMFELPSGHLGLIPLDLEPWGALEVTVVHLSPVQDHSLRVWISPKRGGLGLDLNGDGLSFWHPNRTPGEKVLLLDRDWSGTPTTVWRAEGRAGRFWLSVLNLINQPNAFMVRVDRLPISGGPALPPSEEPPAPSPEEQP